MKERTRITIQKFIRIDNQLHKICNDRLNCKNCPLKYDVMNCAYNDLVGINLYLKDRGVLKHGKK